MSNKPIAQRVANAILRHAIEDALIDMTEDIEIHWPGLFSLQGGKAAFREFFAHGNEIIAHEEGQWLEDGNTVVGTGMVRIKKEDGSVQLSFFSDHYHFREGKVRRIDSYIVNKDETAAQP